MGWRDFGRRRKGTDIGSPLGLGADDDEFEPEEGGPSPFTREIAELRWAAQQEAVTVAARGLDPERWVDGRMAFDIERALAHQHEALRDRLANRVGQRVRDDVRGLYTHAGGIARDYDGLAALEGERAAADRDWTRLRGRIEDDDRELGRYHRRRSGTANVLKYVVAAIIVIGEFVITGIVFERIFLSLSAGLGYVLALGLTLTLVVVPHYLAVGLKGSLTGDDEERRIGRLVTSALAIGLLVMILPLSFLRADGEGDGVDWGAFMLFLLLQYVISGYFFLREWIDHGELAESLHRAVGEKDAVEAAREDAVDRLSHATAAFYRDAEDLVFTIQQAPRWDSYIVEEFNATLRYFRHLLATEHPIYEEFIVWARVPYLGARAGVAGAEFPLDPVSEEHLSLDEAGPLGREWWYRTAADALRSLGAEPGGEEPDGGRGEASWLVTRSPHRLLEEFLGRFFGLELGYRRPAAPPVIVPDAPPNGRAPLAGTGTGRSDGTDA